MFLKDDKSHVQDTVTFERFMWAKYVTITQNYTNFCNFLSL